MTKFHHRKYTMLVGLVLFVFTILLITIVLSTAIVFLLYRFNIMPGAIGLRFPFMIMVLLIASTIIGTALTAIVGKRPLIPFRKLADATREIAAGNFDVRVDMQGPVEMQRLGEDFNQMARELGSMETLRSDFVSNVSHEFKTPIVSIRGFAKLLKKDTLSAEERREYLDIIIKESERLSNLAENVLLLSKLENQDIIRESESFFLDEQLRRAIVVLEPVWSKKGLVFNVDLDPVIYAGSKELLQQVWMNLLGNAVKFTAPGDVVTASIHKTEDTVVVEISDTGAGMGEETMKHLFDKFYQGDKSHASQGNGLGLSLAKQIIGLHGGGIRVESEPGKGSAFFVTLPL